MGGTMARTKVARGLHAELDPHLSFSQLDRAGLCLAWHEAEYRRGMTLSSKAAAFGRAVHEAIQAIDAALGGKTGGLGPDDLEAAKRRVSRHGDVLLHAKFSEWVERYAERANRERTQIVGTEVPVWAWLKIGAVGRNPLRVPVMDLERKAWTRGPCRSAAVKLVGRIDRLDRGPMQDDAVIIERKTWGHIPSRDELASSLQLGLYAWALRQPEMVEQFRLNPAREYIGRWESVYHGVQVEVALDVRTTDDVARKARDLVLRLIEDGTRPAVFHSRCLECPLSSGARCKVFRAELRGDGSLRRILRPSLGEYQKLGARITVFDQLHEQAAGLIRTRVEAVGGVLVEDGFRAELKHSKGGLPDQYQGKTHEELLEALKRQPGTRLHIRAAGR